MIESIVFDIWREAQPIRNTRQNCILTAAQDVAYTKAKEYLKAKMPLVQALSDVDYRHLTEVLERLERGQAVDTFVGGLRLIADSV